MQVDWNQVWTITLVGFGTVFCVLVVLTIILSQFSKLFNLGKKKKVEVAPAPVQAAPSAPASGVDGALIAAITAAIAAASGKSASSFRIASVQPTAGGFTTPAWGHIDRIQRAPQGRLN